MGTKTELRLALKQKLGVLNESEQFKLSQKLSSNLRQLLNDLGVIQKNLVIGVYAPIEHEPKWFTSLDESFHKLTAYPAFESGVMLFKKATLSELVESQDFGVTIFGPKAQAQVVEPQVLLIPGLGFGTKGERLGRGKGFYDRYLESHPVIKIGVAFEVQMENDIPTEAHDIKMDFVVTDQEVYITNR